MSLKLITPPSTQPVTLNEVKNALGYYCNDEDDKINGYILAATEYAQEFQKKRVYITQTWEQYLQPEEKIASCKPQIYPRLLSRYIEQVDTINILKTPVQAVVHIKYKDSTGTEHTVDADNYILSNDGLIVSAYGKTIFPVFTPYPADAITVRFTAGYGNAGDVPARIKQAIILLCKHFDYVDTNGRDKIAENQLESAHRLLWLDRAW